MSRKTKVIVLSLLALVCFQFRTFAQVIPFQRINTDVGNIGLSITNVGTLGKPNVRSIPNGPPSMRYPINSGVEHLFEGGLWIGAYVNGGVAVSTAAVDASNGYQTGAAGFEFTQLSGFTQRSKLTNSEFFSNSAISHQDYIVNFTDSNAIIPGTLQKIEGHLTPLKAVVKMESYAWNFSYADYFVILNYTIKNQSNNTWDSLHLGMWTDLVVRNVKVTLETGTAFFNKGNNGYIDTLHAIYTSQVSGDDVNYTRSYGSTQILGAIYKGNYFFPNNDSVLNGLGYQAPKVIPNFWGFNEVTGDFTTPRTDDQRMERMKKTFFDFNDPATQRSLSLAANRTQYIGIGALPALQPGEEISFAIAYVCAPQLNDRTDTLDTKNARKQLASNLAWARRTYLGEDINGNGILDVGEDINGNNKLDRFILPEPPSTPKTKFIVGSNSVDIYWDKSSVYSIDPISRIQDFEGFRVYMTNAGDDITQNSSSNLNVIASFDSLNNTIGYNNGFSKIELSTPKQFDGDTTKYYFHYRVDNLLNGWQYQFAVTAFDKGDEKLKIESLESSVREGGISIFPGKTPVDLVSDSKLDVGVYPNPYSTQAAWDGGSSRTRKLYFYNLPEQCDINIYTISGEKVKHIPHNASNYKGEDIQWFRNFVSSNNIALSGGEHAWDLLSENNQLITQGLYLVTVTDKKSGNTISGKFTILK